MRFKKNSCIQRKCDFLWYRVGGVLGIKGKFLVFLYFCFHSSSLFSITCELWIGEATHGPVFSRVEREGTSCMKGKVFRLYCFACFLFLSVLDTVSMTKVLAININVNILEAS